MTTRHEPADVLQRGHLVQLADRVIEADGKRLLQLRTGLDIAQDLALGQLLGVLDQADHCRVAATLDYPVDRDKVGLI